MTIEELEKMLEKAKEEKYKQIAQIPEAKYNLTMNVYSSGLQLIGIKDCKENSLEEVKTSMDELVGYCAEKNNTAIQNFQLKTKKV